MVFMPYTRANSALIPKANLQYAMEDPSRSRLRRRRRRRCRRSRSRSTTATTTAPGLPLAALLISVSAALLLLAFAGCALGRRALASAEGERRSGEAVGKIDLGADGVGEVRDDEDVLDVVVAGSKSQQKFAEKS